MLPDAIRIDRYRCFAARSSQDNKKLYMAWLWKGQEKSYSSCAHRLSRTGTCSPTAARSPFISRFHAQYSPNRISA